MQLEVDFSPAFDRQPHPDSALEESVEKVYILPLASVYSLQLNCVQISYVILCRLYVDAMEIACSLVWFPTYFFQPWLQILLTS